MCQAEAGGNNAKQLKMMYLVNIFMFNPSYLVGQQPPPTVADPPPHAMPFDHPTAHIPSSAPDLNYADCCAWYEQCWPR